MPRDDHRRDTRGSNRGGNREAKVEIIERRKAGDARQTPKIESAVAAQLAATVARETGKNAVVSAAADSTVKVDWPTVETLALQPTTDANHTSITKMRMLAHSRMMGAPEGYTPAGSKRGRMG